MGSDALSAGGAAGARRAAAARRRDLAIVTAAGVAVAAAFLNKAVHVDDPVYLSVARQILVDPLLPFSAPINWQQVTEPTWNVMLSPPGFSYWLAGWMALGVTGDLALHAVGAVWTVGLALATYGWARRLGTWPVGATIFVLGSPFVVAGQNLMLDVPMLALSTGAITIYLRASDRDSAALALCAGVLAGLAVNVKYAGFVAAAVMFLDALLWRRPRMLLAGVTGLLFFVGGQAASWTIYGVPQILHARQWMGAQWPSTWGDLLHRLSSSVLYLGAGAVWLALLSGGLFQRSRIVAIRLIVATAGAAAAIVDLRSVEPQMLASALIHAVVFAFSGWLAIAWVASEIVRARLGVDPAPGTPETIARLSSRDGMILIAWTLGFWYLGSIGGPFVAPRSILPCLLSLVLLIQALTSVRSGPGPNARGIAIALTVALGLAVGAADADWAGVYRDAAPRIANGYRPADGRLYFLGHWGWQHYAEAAGMTQFDPLRTQLEPGDILIVPRNVDDPLPVAEILRCCRGVARETVSAHRWLPRTRDPDGFIFLYGDTRHGRIPWGWSSASHPLDQFLIFRVDG